jgi:hypothetical protein
LLDQQGRGFLVEVAARVAAQQVAFGSAQFDQIPPH